VVCGAGVAVRPILTASKCVSVVAPEARLLHRVTAMTFVGDDEVEGVNGDVELVGIRLGFGVAAGLREAAFRAEEIPRHALDGGDVNEGVRGLGSVRYSFGSTLGSNGSSSPKSSF
jgi:hypothetical protein